MVHGPVPRPDLGLGRGLDRRLWRTPERSEEQGLVRGREQRPEQMLFRATGQGLERRPLPTPRQTPMRWPERMSLQEPERRLQRVLERGSFRGQELPQRSGGWSRYARGTSFQFAVGSVKAAEPSERKRLRTDEGRGTMDEETNHVTFWGCGFSNTGDTHNEPYRASVWPVPDNLYVVVRHSRNHNSPVEWANQGLLPGQVQDEDSSKVEVKVQIEVRNED